MEKYSLDQLLRYALAGVALLFTFGALYGFENLKPEGVDPTVLVAIGAAAVLFLGSLIHVLHRATVVPLMYSLLLRQVWGSRQELVNMDLQRWERRGRDGSLQKNLDQWASQIHFLYCTTSAVALGILTGTLLHLPPKLRCPKVLWCGVGVTAFAAIFHHWRYLKCERAVTQREQSTTSRSDGARTLKEEWNSREDTEDFSEL
jgi:hypothetical protein